MRLISTSMGGLASRSFISGSRLWPPASTLASSCARSRWRASATDRGAAYLKDAGITGHLPRATLHPRGPVVSTVSRSRRLELLREQPLDDPAAEQEPVHRALLGEHPVGCAQPAATARAVSSEDVYKYKQFSFSAVPAGSIDHWCVALRARD